MCCYHHLHHLCCEVDEFRLVPLQTIHPPELSYVQWSCQETIRALINIQSGGRAPDFGTLTFYENLCAWKEHIGND